MEPLTFKKIYDEYGPPVYRFLLALSGDEAFAEELLQETFYQALIYIDRFEGRCSIYAWLCQIGKNIWSKESKRRARIRALDEVLSEQASSSLEEDYIDKDEYVRTRLAVHHLKEPYKGVLLLHVYGGLKLKEIASLYNKTESWARVTFYRAKEQIIKEVKQ